MNIQSLMSSLHLHSDDSRYILETAYYGLADELVNERSQVITIDLDSDEQFKSNKHGQIFRLKNNPSQLYIMTHLNERVKDCCEFCFQCCFWNETKPKCHCELIYTSLSCVRRDKNKEVNFTFRKLN